jgi:two-component system, cell cycle sensor histidine kinase and response regulator CckA
VTATPEKHVVMVVDDDDSVRRVTARALESFGFATLGARDGFDAVKQLESQRGVVRCVIVDMSMPGWDGEQTLKGLHEIDGGLPVLLASGHSAQEMREKYAQSGFAGYLQKPFQIALLADAVARAIADGKCQP